MQDESRLSKQTKMKKKNGIKVCTLTVRSTSYVFLKKWDPPGEE